MNRNPTGRWCWWVVIQAGVLSRLQIWDSRDWTACYTFTTPLYILNRFRGVWFWDPMHCSLPGPSVHGILQARILEWVAISFSRASSWPRDRDVTHSHSHSGIQRYIRKEDVIHQIFFLHLSFVSMLGKVVNKSWAFIHSFNMNLWSRIPSIHCLRVSRSISVHFSLHVYQQRTITPVTRLT